MRATSLSPGRPKPAMVTGDAWSFSAWLSSWPLREAPLALVPAEPNLLALRLRNRRTRKYMSPATRNATTPPATPIATVLVVVLLDGEVTCGVSPIVFDGIKGAGVIEGVLVSEVVCALVNGVGVIVEESASVVVVADSDSTETSSEDSSEELLLLLRTLMGRFCQKRKSEPYVRH